MSDDPKLSQRYRELPREEPSRALDDAILAASRRAMTRRRWYVPLATAALLALVVGVTLHLQHDRPGEEVDAVSPSMQVQQTPKPETPQRQAPPAKAAPPADAAPPAAAEAPPSAPAAREERKQVGELASQSVGARAAPEAPVRAHSQMARASVPTSPETQLERIAELRAAGRHEEADRALAEFRKRYPDYRLSDAMKAKVERR